MRRKIFISYRRQDSTSEALSIAQFLEREFGTGSVFMDIDIHAGANFPIVLEEQLSQCKVLLAVIGPNWLETKDSEGQLRLSKPDDWVRLEIVRALERDVPVIPVCINDTKLPDRMALPENLRRLVDHQAAFVTTSRFRNDMAGLVRDIRTIPDALDVWRRGITAAALFLVVFSAGAVVRYRLMHSDPVAPPAVQAAPAASATPRTDAVQLPNHHGTGTNTGSSNSTERAQNQSNGSNMTEQPKELKELKLRGTIQFRSDAGDYIGGGRSWTLRDADGVFSATVHGSSVDIHYRGDDNWDLTFTAPEGQRLMAGVYANASRAPFNSPVKPGLSVDGAGRGCNTLTGQFNIRQIEYSGPGSRLRRLLADFEQHCEGSTPVLSGTVDLTAIE